MVTEQCPNCGDTLYPDDEKVFWDHEWYHVECAEELQLPLDEEEQEKSTWKKWIIRQFLKL